MDPQVKPASGNDEKIANYYNAYSTPTRSIGRARAGQADLDAIAAIADKRQLSAAIGETLRADVDLLNATNFHTENLFGLLVAPGLASPASCCPTCCRAASGCPIATITSAADATMVDMRNKYQAYVADRFCTTATIPTRRRRGAHLRSRDQDRRGPRDAREHRGRQEGRDIWTRAELEQQGAGPRLGRVPRRGAARQAAEVRRLSLGAIPGLAALVGSSRCRRGRTASAFHTLNQQRTCCPKPSSTSFAFYGRCFRARRSSGRAKRAVDETSDALGEAVGKAYVEKYFPAAAKAADRGDGRQSSGRVRPAHRGVDWMAPETKAGSAKKVAEHRVGVGYPDKWRDYSALTISADDAYGNREREPVRVPAPDRASSASRWIAREWFMPPQLVNAVNLPVQNALNFPAAILQAVLRPERRRRRQLRRDRRHHRPRDQPQLRHRRRAVRRERAHCATGGRRRTSRIPARPTRSPRSSTPTKRFPDCTSTAS